MKGGGLAIMLGSPGKGEKGSDDGDEMTDVGQDLLDALASKDAKAVGLALRRGFECCGSGEESSDEE
jgi:hypothetical protein